MMRIFTDAGEHIPVTVLRLDRCQVVGHRTPEKNGYTALQLGAGMTLDQLNDELVKLKKEQFNLRFQAASGQLENTARVREIRRDIARIQTITRQKNAAGAKA